jgi:hypothetical protein
MDAPKKTGRKKIEFSDEMIRKIETLAAQGMSQDQISYALGISKGTYFKEKRNNPTINDVWSRGKAMGIAKVSNALFQAAMGGNVTAMIFWLKANAGWRDVSSVEMTGKDGGPIEVSDAKERLHEKLEKLVAIASEGEDSPVNRTTH